jgi:hypothetical protein
VSAAVAIPRDRLDVDQTARVDRCVHVWGSLSGSHRRCFGWCGVLLIGALAARPPASGIDWSRSVLVNQSALAGSSQR